MDREKVIKGLEYCIADEYCDGCPYMDDCFEIDDKPFGEQLMRDAFELLKEQEAELSYREAKSVTHTATKLDDATCPSCGNVVGEKIRTGAIGQSVVQVQWDYCRFCGQKLDWEGREV